MEAQQPVTYQTFGPKNGSSTSANVVTSGECTGKIGSCQCSRDAGLSETFAEKVNVSDISIQSSICSLEKNESFRSLQLDLSLLNDNVKLAGIPKVAPSRVSFVDVDAKTTPLDRERAITHPPPYVKPHPPFAIYSAPVVSVRELTKPGALKRVFHFEIDVSDYPLPPNELWMVGGSFGLMAPNSNTNVDRLIQLLHSTTDMDAPVIMKTTSGRWPTIWEEDMARELLVTRRELLTWASDFMSIAPKKQLLCLMAQHAQDESEKRVLRFLCSRLGQRAFCHLRGDLNVSLIDLLEAFPSVRLPLDHLLSVLPQLMPRWYSLSNDPASSNGILEFAVTIVEIEKPDHSLRNGVATGYLKSIAEKFLAGERDLCLPMFRGLHRNPFATQFTSDGPMCLIGAGVGVAPFRGFIQRRLMNATCAGKVWVFHGCRNQELDELYQGEWDKPSSRSGSCSPASAARPPELETETEEDVVKLENTKDDGPNHLVVESRSKSHAYVQDELRRKSDIVWSVLSHPNGRIYLCGAKQGFLKGVEDALIDICMKHGGMTKSEAACQLVAWQNPLSLKFVKEIW
ncbi:FAD binding protein [Schizosaccharomyces japonicus yFS275]|uniref:FAD binding protein n=1 Tax=Schizosaccharomyces japonicus (strain yFS275 / FY16936) TaxID=402676 RepID=B6K6V9_SCHJY|nr:FAD binding protein [Schizosaccharomyces japonicus yFS275]EEB09263.2 FAD binding protein [Schizosaccharomyces japonicus yFS275]